MTAPWGDETKPAVGVRPGVCLSWPVLARSEYASPSGEGGGWTKRKFGTLGPRSAGGQKRDDLSRDCPALGAARPGRCPGLSHAAPSGLKTATPETIGAAEKRAARTSPERAAGDSPGQRPGRTLHVHLLAAGRAASRSAARNSTSATRGGDRRAGPNLPGRSKPEAKAEGRTADPRRSLGSRLGLPRPTSRSPTTGKRPRTQAETEAIRSRGKTSGQGRGATPEPSRLRRIIRTGPGREPLMGAGCHAGVCSFPAPLP